MPKRKRSSFGRTLRAKRRLNEESSAEEDTAENAAENDVLHGGRPSEENNVDLDPAQNPNNADTDSENIDNAHGVVLHDLPEAMSYDRDNFVTKATIGKLNVVCNFCRASTFQGERAGLCCNKGKIVLDSYPPPPEDIRYLYINSNTDAKHFLANIKRYNAAFQMTSLGCDEKRFAGWNPHFLIQGQLYHLHGSVIPQENEQPRFLQIYFVDPEEQFPVAPCFAMTFNKSQGQTMKCVGLHLPEPVFTHGMLYVGLSRVGNKNQLFINCPNGLTRNVVYPEILH